MANCVQALDRNKKPFPNGRLLALQSALKKFEDQKTSRQQRGGDDEDGKFLTAPGGEDFGRRNVGGALHSFRRCFEEPGDEYERDKADDQEHDQRFDRPAWYFERGDQGELN